MVVNGLTYVEVKTVRTKERCEGAPTVRVAGREATARARSERLSTERLELRP